MASSSNLTESSSKSSWSIWETKARISFELNNIFIKANLGFMVTPSFHAFDAAPNTLKNSPGPS